jgi:hypothetical protein
MRPGILLLVHDLLNWEFVVVNSRVRPVVVHRRVIGFTIHPPGPDREFTTSFIPAPLFPQCTAFFCSMSFAGKVDAKHIDGSARDWEIVPLSRSRSTVAPVSPNIQVPREVARPCQLPLLQVERRPEIVRMLPYLTSAIRRVIDAEPVESR